MVGAERRRILDRLPYVGLDIESVEGAKVRVEYSPNRPDFGTDYGIARALRGLLGKEVGLPKFPTKPSGIDVAVDGRLSSVRPFIACAAVTGLLMDDEDVRQLISLQEDLHNGLGRKRRTVAIGLHDLDAVRVPLSYHGVGSSFKFVPLGERKAFSISSILRQMAEGKAYGAALSGSDVYPVITDAAGTVLSFPPIINGDATRVTTKTKNIFIDVTSTDQKAGDNVLAVVATTMAEMGGRVGTVSIRYGKKSRITPDLEPVELPLDDALIRSVLGMDLNHRQIVTSLGRSRLGVKGKKAVGPRYRIDLLHPVDIAEEVALGYGMDRIMPDYPPSKQAGSLDGFEEFLDAVATIMAGSEMVELMTFELTDSRSLYSNFGRSEAEKVVVQNPKSIDHSVLRDSLFPGLMTALSGNVKSDYPQRVFEVGRVYSRTKEGVSEAWHLGCMIAHSQANFTEAKMHLESVCRILTGEEASSAPGSHWSFVQGRCASVSIGNSEVGVVGEVKPEAIEAFGLGVPVSGFGVNLSRIYERLK